MYFLACVLTIQFKTKQEPLNVAEYPHLQREIARALFATEEQRSRLLTVACLHSDHQHLVLRLTLAEEHPGCVLAHPLCCISSEQRILLCQREGELSACDFSDPVWTGVSTWADLHADSSPSSFHFTFVTPLITSVPLIQEHPDALPFPEPALLFSSVHARWQDLSGPPLACSVQRMVQETRCVLAEYHLRTVDIPALQRTGYLGWVEYRCLQPREREIAALWTLARLAFFTGYGYATACGCGTARALSRKEGKTCAGAW